MVVHPDASHRIVPASSKGLNVSGQAKDEQNNWQHWAVVQPVSSQGVASASAMGLYPSGHAKELHRIICRGVCRRSVPRIRGEG